MSLRREVWWGCVVWGADTRWWDDPRVCRAKGSERIGGRPGVGVIQARWYGENGAWAETGRFG